MESLNVYVVTSLYRVYYVVVPRANEFWILYVDFASIGWGSLGVGSEAAGFVAIKGPSSSYNFNL